MLIFVIITNVIINTIWLLTHLLYVWFVSKFQLFEWESSLVTVVLSETVASEPGWLLYNKKKHIPHILIYWCSVLHIEFIYITFCQWEV